MQVILPVDNASNTLPPYKTIYLLHGLRENLTAWTANTLIEKWAMDLGVAIVMPSGENAFYVDTPIANSAFGDFGAFIGEELVSITRKIFPLSHKREDTFIGGLSMGGYGAIRNGLKHADTFGHIAVFSGAVHFFEYPLDTPGLDLIGEKYCFGPSLVDAQETDMNPRVAAQQLLDLSQKDKTKILPRIYICCGTEDFLLGANRSLAEFLKEKGFDVTYEESAGEHDWVFWNEYLPKVLKWFS